jgi:DNA-binding beta-propeller fold protein YncE
MRKLSKSHSALGVICALVGILFGAVSCSNSDSSSPAAAGVANSSVVNFIATDEPGPWFKCVGNGCVPAGTESLAIVKPNTNVKITMGKESNTVHTFTSLLYPTGAKNMPFDQKAAFRGSQVVKLVDPGLYVFVCKLHPFMLAATIVDDPATVHPTKVDGAGKPVPAYDLGETFDLVNGINNVPTSSDLATRLLKTFFVITNPANYQDRNVATNPTLIWHINYPAGVDVRITGGAVVDLKDTLETRYPNDVLLGGALIPTVRGVGEVWVDLQFEKTSGKTKPGTATAVDVATWVVSKRVTLPVINMNNPHNMWASADQSTIYQTQWFDTKLTAFDRTTGVLKQNIEVGEAPAHVMTRVDTDQVHVSLNGDNAIMELHPLATGINRRILTQFPGEDPAQPHAHWMSHDGHTMVTPNSNTGDSTKIDIPTGTITAKTITGTLPIASSMMPDASKYYVSNYLDSSITCISITTDACKGVANLGDQTKTIPLLLAGSGALGNYNPISGAGFASAGGLPIQTPVSPDGKFVVTANTLTATITIIDTATDTLVAVLPCSAGCHGLNFGAKSGGGYYAYVSSKFSNDLLVVDLNGAASTIVGRIILAASGTSVDDTSGAITLAGMGGQGVLPVPNVYNGWVQKLPHSFCSQLSPAQQNPLGNLPSENCP